LHAEQLSLSGGAELAAELKAASADHLEWTTPSMQMILSIACSQMRLTPAEAITAATINPAYSLGLGESVGSLEPGKQADVVIYDCADYRQIPYLFGINHAVQVIKKGRVIIDRRN
jgi:imidazolonepropionase